MSGCRKRLILTGWGWKDYACAAALALRHLKVANIRGMSQRRLPEFLNTASGWDEIVILGIGLTTNPELLATALKRLLKQGVKVQIISTLDVPEILRGDDFSKLDVFVGGTGITDAVSLCYKIDYDDLAPVLEEKKPSKSVKQWHLLIEAAMYVYRNYQDEKAYEQVIRHLAYWEPESRWTSSERQMIEHYKRYGNREIVGDSTVIQDLLGKIGKIAPHDQARVLILGESGTGKETVRFSFITNHLGKANCLSLSIVRV